MTQTLLPDDVPASPPSFGFSEIGVALARMLLSRKSHAFVLGVHGPWGSGKSTLLGAIRAELGPTLIVEFNAWKYQDREALWRALILRVVEAVKEGGGDAALADELHRSLYSSFTVEKKGSLQVDWTAAATEGALLAMRIGTANMAPGLIDGIGDGLNKLFNRKSEPDAKIEDVAKGLDRIGKIFTRQVTKTSVEKVVSIEQFLSNFTRLIDSLGEDRRIAVLIDDLDRCLPENSLEIFEAIKLFLDAPACTYVVAVDRDVIARGLAVRYAGKGALPVDPDEYIEKTITLSFDVPLLSDADGEALLRSGLGRASLTAEQIAAVLGVLGSNPRRVKRFARLADLHAHLRATGTVSPHAFDDLSLKLLLINYCSSALFGRLLREPALGQRLQQAVNTFRAALRQNNANSAAAWSELVGRLKLEDAAVEPAFSDRRLLAAFALEPVLGDAAAIGQALRWFRQV